MSGQAGAEGIDAKLARLSALEKRLEILVNKHEGAKLGDGDELQQSDLWGIGLSQEGLDRLPVCM
jgi:hypothetical protein